MPRLMSNMSSQADLLTEAERIASALSARLAEVPHLGSPRARLETMLLEARGLLAEQGALTARKQEVTQRLRETLVSMARLITFLRFGVKEHYGPRSEQIVEFGLQPFRGRKRRSAGVEETGAPPVE